MDDKIKEVSELLKKDLNDEIVVMQLMTYPKPELVIAGLIKMIKDDRAKFDEQMNSIYKRIDKLEARTKEFNNTVDSMHQIINFVKNQDSNKTDTSTK